MNKTILGLKCKMQQIEPKKEIIEPKVEQVESTSENIALLTQVPESNVGVKNETQVNTDNGSIKISESQISLRNPPLSNDDITQLLVETADKPVAKAPTVDVVPKDDDSGKLNGSEAETIDSIEGFMRQIHEQDSIKVNQNVPSTSTSSKSPKKSISKSTIEPAPSTSKEVIIKDVSKSPKKSISKSTNEPAPSTSKEVINKDVSKSPKKSISKSTKEPVPSTSNEDIIKKVSKSPKKSISKSTNERAAPKSSILLPSPSFENALSSITTKAYKIPKLSKKINQSEEEDYVPRGRSKRLISSSSESDAPIEKKSKPKKRNVIFDSESSGEDNLIVKSPVINTKVKAKETKSPALEPEKNVNKKKKNGEKLKTLVGKLPDSEVKEPETSELILSLESLVGIDGLKKMKSIFVNPTDAINTPSTSANVLEETVTTTNADIEMTSSVKNLKATVEKSAKRSLSNLETSKSAKKQKMIEEICDAVVKQEPKISPKLNHRKKNELDRLNADIDNMFIRDSVLTATGKRACTLKQTTEEISLRNDQKLSEMKKCSVVMHQLELNMDDKPFKVYNFPLANKNANVGDEIDLNLIEPVIAKPADAKPVVAKPAAAKPVVAKPVLAKPVAVVKKPNLKKKTKKNKPKSPWTRLACKKLDIKDEEWEDVEDDQVSNSSSPVVEMEQNVTDTAENINNVIESDDKVVTENEAVTEPEIIKLVQIPNPIEVPTPSTSVIKVADAKKIPNGNVYVIPFKKVYNLSYSILNCATVYKCTCGDCKFQTLNKPAFIGHINDNHMSMPWSGYCGICMRKVIPERTKLFIISEYLHMFEKHIQQETLAPTGVLSKNAGNSKDNLGFVNSPTLMPKITVGNQSYSTNTKTIVGSNAGSIVGKIIPMVKIPMNYIMKTNNQKVETKVVPKEKNVENPIPIIQAAIRPVKSSVIRAPASTSWTQTVINAPKEVSPTIMYVKPVPDNISYVIYDNKPNEMLRPWLSTSLTMKNQQLCKEMLSEICLVATFKCMAKTCSYFTNCENYFRKHLKAHAQFQCSDRYNFTKCAYCTFQSVTCEGLVEHIKGVHKYDRFQCPHCFYRTVVDFNVLTHMDLFHKMKPKMFIECSLTHVKNYSVELETIKRTRASYVPPIVCVFCKAKFYVFKSFIDHVNAHKEVCNTKCIKCNETTNKSSLHKHLVNCHGFGLFQCVYCKYGTNTFEIINHHLTNKHPNKLPMFCERSQAQSSTQIPVSSIDSTCLKHINQVVNSNLIKKPSYSDAALLNHDKVGKLAHNLTIQKVCDYPVIHSQSEDLTGSNVLFDSLENDPKLLNHQVEELPAHITYNASAVPSVVALSNKQCKLQIGSVYSLHDKKN
ncbi:unnamed protein product [Diamesa hyperborea]